MRFAASAFARLARIALPSSLVVFTVGCATSSFGGYDQQACAERALRRAHDPALVARARGAFEEECHRGGAEACSALGVMNEVGVGVAMNPTRAAELYRRACDAGNARGCANLGVATVLGIGLPRNPAAGARLLEPACSRGDARACLHLARLYDDGDGALHNAEQAVQLFERACAGEEPSACIALGDARARDGDTSDAADLYGKACSLGDAVGCNRFDAPRGPARQEVADRMPP